MTNSPKFSSSNTENSLTWSTSPICEYYSIKCIGSASHVCHASNAGILLIFWHNFSIILSHAINRKDDDCTSSYTPCNSIVKLIFALILEIIAKLLRACNAFTKKNSICKWKKNSTCTQIWLVNVGLSFCEFKPRREKKIIRTNRFQFGKFPFDQETFYFSNVMCFNVERPNEKRPERP